MTTTGSFAARFLAPFAAAALLGGCSGGGTSTVGAGSVIASINGAILQTSKSSPVVIQEGTVVLRESAYNGAFSAKSVYSSVTANGNPVYCYSVVQIAPAQFNVTAEPIQGCTGGNAINGIQFSDLAGHSTTQYFQPPGS
jgi:hypothetical protein